MPALSTLLAVAVALALFVPRAGLQAQSADLQAIAARVGAYVQQYFERARHVLVEETVVLQPLLRDLGPDGFARRLIYEARVEWDPAEIPAARILRQLVSARGPALGPPGQPDCLDPRGLSPEPLEMLLPERQGRVRFAMAGADRVNGRQTLRIDYRPVVAEPPKVEWNDQCGHIELPGRMRGRIWVDPLSGEVLRFDERLTGPVDVPGPRTSRRFGPLWFTIERADTTIEYRAVRFENPDETLLLPARVETISIIPNSGVPRMRITQTYANYRRFVTESRLVGW